MSNFFNKPAKLAFSLIAVAALAACGGGDEVLVGVVEAPVVIAVSPATAPAAIATLSAAKTFSFPAAVPALGTTAATTLTFAAPVAGASTVPFTLASGGVSSKGILSFGSCIFTITESPVGTVLTTPIVYTIPTAQCNLNVDPVTGVADNTLAPAAITISLGGTPSAPVQVSIVVTANGTITVDGVAVGTAPIIQITGAGN
jgi:hypothetical protein